MPAHPSSPPPPDPGSKALVKRWLRRAGVVAVSGRHAGSRYLDHPPGTAFESALLRRFENLDGLNFIQVGANDGSRADALVRFIGPCRWGGLMIEPLPVPFAALQRRHGANPRLSLLQAAVADRASSRAIHHLRPDAPVPDWAWGVAGFDREHVRAAARELGLGDADLRETAVRTITWDDVLAAFGPRRCDILMIDVEGYDLELLRLAPLARLRPTVIQFEHACCSRPDVLRCYGELLDLGYEIATEGPDTVAHRPAPGSTPA